MNMIGNANVIFPKLRHGKRLDEEEIETVRKAFEEYDQKKKRILERIPVFI